MKHLGIGTALLLSITQLSLLLNSIESVATICEGSDTNISLYGYKDWQTLHQDVTQLHLELNRTIAQRNIVKYPVVSDTFTFMICPNSLLVAESDDVTINLPAGVNTNLICGPDGVLDDNCTISGGRFEMIFEVESSKSPNLVNVEISGIKMVNASAASIEIIQIDIDQLQRSLFRFDPDNDGNSIISVMNCEFSNNTGRPIHLNSATFLIIVDRCTFIDNESFAAVHVERGEAFIINSIILSTTGNAIWVSSGGTISLQNNCFIDNQQVVTIESDSILVLEQSYDNYAQNSMVGSQCLGFFLLIDTSCLNFDSVTCLLISAPSMVPIISMSPTQSNLPTFVPTSSPTVALSISPTLSLSPSLSSIPSSRPSLQPSLSPSLSVSPSTSSPPTSQYCIDGSQGYVYWTTLLNDVQSSDGNEQFVICPKAIFYPRTIDYGSYNASDISIYASNIIVQCGESGLSENNCIFEGGLSHFFLGGNANNVTLKGLTLKGATESSILAYARSSAAVAFIDCVFQENYDNLGSAITVRNAANAENPGMNVVIKNCSFINNVSPLATILSYGHLQIEDSVILGTSTNTSQGWAVVLSGFGELFMSTSCLENNVNSVFLLDDAKLNANINNFGFNNTSGIGSCEGVYIDSRDECSQFTSNWCRLYAAPSTTPSTLPSNRPIGPTTLKPTFHPNLSAPPTPMLSSLPSISSGYTSNYHSLILSFVSSFWVFLYVKK